MDSTIKKESQVCFVHFLRLYVESGDWIYLETEPNRFVDLQIFLSIIYQIIHF